MPATSRSPASAKEQIAMVLGSRWQPNRWRTCSAALLGLALVLFVAANATAHSALTSTDPVDGAVLPEQPPFVTLIYNQNVSLADDGMRLFDDAGTATPLDATASGSTVHVTLPENLADGSYALGWRVISADGHPIAGALTFAIGAASDEPVAGPTEENDKTVDRLLGIAQGLGYIGLLATVGLVVFRAFVMTADTPVPAGSARLSQITAVLAVLATVLALPLTIARQQGTGLDSVLDIGDWVDHVSRDEWTALLAIAVGLAIATIVTPRFRPSTGTRSLTLVAIGVAIAAPSLLGHTRSFDPTWLIVPSNLLHTATGAVWFGGLLGLGLLLRRGTREPSESDSLSTATVVARFSTLAGFLVGLLAVSGVVTGWIILGALKPLTSTDYGKLLLVKAGAAVIVVLLAAWNRFRLVPAIEAMPGEPARQSRLRHSVATEAAILIGVLLVTGFLVNQSPEATAAPTNPETTPMPIAFSAPLGEGTVEGSIAPGTAGTNRITFLILDHHGMPIVPENDPTLQWSLHAAELGPFEATAVATGEPGTYAADINLPLSGQWTFSIAVRVSMFDEPIAQVPIDVP